MVKEGGGVVYEVCRIILIVFSILYVQKGVQVIIGLKINIRNMSSVTILKNKNKKGILIIYKSCFKRLILSLLV